MQNQKCKMRNIKGFSLVEIIFAMFFLTIILFGVVSLQSSNLAMLHSQNQEIQAHFYANQGLQIVETIGYGAVKAACELPNGECKISFTDPNYSVVDKAGSPEDIDDVFQRSFTVDNRPNPGDDNVFRVVMTVEWEDSTGTHNVKAKRIIY